MKNLDHKKIAILYICTGRYVMFLNRFVETAEKYLLNDTVKEYFIFTDFKFNEEPDERIHIIPQSKLGWPYDTLKRYNMFLSIKNLLLEFDYIFFYNANSVFKSLITKEEILPTKNDNWLSGVLHSGYYGFPNNQLNFEKNKDSTAYININNTPMYYYQGALFGGRSNEFVEMCEILNDNIEMDLKNGIIAVWHDESHLNHYFNLVKPPKKLHPYFSYPELAPVSPFIPNVDYSAKTIQLDKNKLGGQNFLRS